MIRRRSPISRRSRPARKRRTPLAALHRRLWAAFAGWIKERDRYRCYTCLAPDLSGSNCQAGHFETTRRASTRYDPINVHVQCYRCNISLRGNSLRYAERFVLDYGIEALHTLKRHAEIHKAWRAWELEELIPLVGTDAYSATYRRLAYGEA